MEDDGYERSIGAEAEADNGQAESQGTRQYQLIAGVLRQELGQWPASVQEVLAGYEQRLQRLEAFMLGMAIGSKVNGEGEAGEEDARAAVEPVKKKAV